MLRGCHCFCTHIQIYIYMGLHMRNPVLGVLRTTKTQTSLYISRLINAFVIGKYHIKTCYKPNFTILGSLCSWAGRVWVWTGQKPWRQGFSRRGPYIYIWKPALFLCSMTLCGGYLTEQFIIIWSSENSEWCVQKHLINTFFYNLTEL